MARMLLFCALLSFQFLGRPTVNLALHVISSFFNYFIKNNFTIKTFHYAQVISNCLLPLNSHRLDGMFRAVFRQPHPLSWSSVGCVTKQHPPLPPRVMRAATPRPVRQAALFSHSLAGTATGCKCCRLNESLLVCNESFCSEPLETRTKSKSIKPRKRADWWRCLLASPRPSLLMWAVE